MRLSRMQLTIRRMMMAVAVVGVVFSIPAALQRQVVVFARISQARFYAANALIFRTRVGPPGLSSGISSSEQQYQAAATRPGSRSRAIHLIRNEFVRAQGVNHMVHPSKCLAEWRADRHAGNQVAEVRTSTILPDAPHG